jgi:beta-galactosidase/beta-glucuronidase
MDHSGEPIAVSGPWQLAFTQGGPALPSAQQLDQLISWTELPDTTATRFSGTAMYTTRFNLPEKSADEYLLQLGDVRESARVWVNDQEVGILWSVPYQARIGPYLRAGENTLRVEVANLMANRIRDLDLRGMEWRRYHEINFVNLNYEPFDASGWEPQPSGLLGPVSILPITTDHTL